MSKEKMAVYFQPETMRKVESEVQSKWYVIFIDTATSKEKILVAVGDYIFESFVISLTRIIVQNKWIILHKCEKIILKPKAKERCLLNKNSESPYSKLEMKKKTLTDWTKLLLNSGEIDIKKYNRMIMMIERLAA